MAKIDTSLSYGIYRITSPNGSCYIGMTTKSFDERWDGHRANFRKGQMTCIGLERAFKKHTPEAMKFEVLEDMTGYGENEVLYRERLWWLRHKAWGANLYNGEPTGRGAVRHTDETRRRISESLRKNLVIEKICPQCRNNFIARVKDQIFCSRSCVNMRDRLSPRTGLTSRVSKADLVRFKEQQISKQDIAKLLGCSVQSVCDLERYYGVRIPKKSRQKKSKFRLTCETCSESFFAKLETQTFCSKSCYWNRNRV